MTLTYAQRLALLAGISAAVILAVLVRLYGLQIVDNARWRDTLESRSSFLRDIDGERGRILAADGALLAADGPGFDLMVVTAGWAGRLHRCTVCANEIYLRPDPENRQLFKRCPKCKQPAGEVLRDLSDRCDLGPLARLLGTTADDLRDELDTLSAKHDRRVEEEMAAVEKKAMSDRRRGNLKIQLRGNYGWQPIVLRRDVSYEVAREIILNPDRNPPFRIQETRTRRNFGAAPFAHMIGRKPDLVVRARSRTYAAGKEGGGRGLENALDAELRGEPGSARRAPDPDRRNRLAVVDRQAPVAGLDVRLTIAMRDQSAAQDALADAVGAFVVVDARTGAVVAMTTAPTYDPERFGQVVQEWGELEREALARKERLRLPTPLWDRSVRGAYPPGSTMKPFTGLAGMTGGILSPDETIRCDRFFVLNGNTMQTSMTCMDSHGPIALQDALVKSCNIYFQTIVERLIRSGREPHFESTLRMFGFGEPTGLEMESASISDRTLRLHPEKGRVGLSARIQAGIGQGRVTATAAQVARAYAGLATGSLPVLHVVAAVGNTPKAIESKRIDIPAGMLEAVRRGLREKTAHDASLNHPAFARYGVATKTGTAQRRNTTKYTAWLAGFADAQSNRPAIAFAMVIEDSDEYGGAQCGDRVARFLARFYGADSE